MKTLGQRLRAARKAGGYTQKELARRIGARHNSVSNWENGQNMPDTATLEALCGALGVTADYLLLGESAAASYAPAVPASVTAEEWSFLQRLRGVDAAARAAVGALLDHYCGAARSHLAEAETQRAAERAVPALALVEGLISVQSVAAGWGTYLDDDAFEPIRLVKNAMTEKTAFYVPVAGDSMEPRFHDGDVLMVEKAAVRPGEIGIFTLDGRGYVKALGNRELLSLNPEYAPIPMDESILCNGKVIGVLDPDWIVAE